MNGNGSSERIQKYFPALQSEQPDFVWLEETLGCYPDLVRVRMSDGTLPMRAVLKGRNSALFELLADRGAEHDIITASYATDLAAVERFLSEMPDCVYETDEEGNTPLHWACKAHSDDAVCLVRLLLAAGSCVDARNVHGHTPLECDLLDGRGEACEELIDHGAAPNVLYGVVTEDFELLDEVFDDDPEIIHWRNSRNGESLLHFAATWGCSLTMFEFLFARGAEAEIGSQCDGWTPLIWAVQMDHFDAAEILIQHGADANDCIKRNGRSDLTALRLAVQRDRVGLAELLIARGASIHERWPHGRTLLAIARSAAMVNLLIRAGIDPAIRDDFGRSPLELSIEEGERGKATILARHEDRPTFFHYVGLGDCSRVQELLIDDPSLIAAHPERPNFPLSDTDEDAEGIPLGSNCGTALHYAVKSGVHNMVKMLLDRGAEVNAVDGPNRWTPLHDATYYTIWRDFREGNAIIRTLVCAGADLDAKTVGGFRPLDIAKFWDCYETASDVFDLLLALKQQMHQEWRRV